MSNIVKHTEARNQLHSKRYSDALTILQKLIENDSSNASYFATRGKTYTALNDLNSALRDFNKAIELSKNNSSFYGYRGKLHYRLKNYTEAEHDLLIAINMSKGILPFHWTLGKLYLETNNLERAVHYLKIARHKNEHPQAAKLLSLCYLKQNNFIEALRALNHAELNSSNDYWIQFSIGRCYYMFGTYEERITEDGRKWKENPLIPESDRDQYYNQALKYLSHSIELNPTYAFSYWMRGQIQFTFGLIEESAADHSNAIKYKPDEVEFYKGWELAHNSLL